jgi:hypothetical protein
LIVAVTALVLLVGGHSGHAHNDYLHPRPLWDAYERGFRSLEVDVFPVNGELWVAHERKELQPNRTLRALYLQPLAEKLAAGDWKGPLQILVDFKADGEQSYELLSREVAGFPALQSVSFVISGARPLAVFEPKRGLKLDGRWSDERSKYSTEQMPLVSEAWRSHFRWNGVGVMPDDQREKLISMVRQVQGEGRKVRFWGAPDTEAAWKVQQDAGVNWINTDRLAPFALWAGTGGGLGGRGH